MWFIICFLRLLPRLFALMGKGIPATAFHVIMIIMCACFFSVAGCPSCFVIGDAARNVSAMCRRRPACTARAVSEHYLAAGAVAAHYIHAGGLAQGGGGAAIHLASLHVVEGQVQLLRVVQRAVINAYALRHGRCLQAGGAYGLQVEFIPNGCRLVVCQRCGGHIYGNGAAHIQEYVGSQCRRSGGKHGHFRKAGAFNERHISNAFQAFGQAYFREVSAPGEGIFCNACHARGNGIVGFRFAGRILQQCGLVLVEQHAAVGAIGFVGFIHIELRECPAGVKRIVSYGGQAVGQGYSRDMLAVVSPEYLNAAIPMLVTVLGMVIPVSDVQLKNASSPMVVRPSGRVIPVSDVQLANAAFPMVVTPLPMLRTVLVHCLAARSPSRCRLPGRQVILRQAHTPQGCCPRP